MRLNNAYLENFVARIAGVNIPTNKRVEIALQYIHGIGPAAAKDITLEVICNTSEVADIRYGLATFYTKRLFGIFLLYGLMRALGALAVSIGSSRRRYPRFVVKFFDRLDAWLKRIVRVPSLPKLRSRPRIQKSLSTAVRIQNPMQGEGLGSGADVRAYVESSYAALCALAYDMGVPRNMDQTPYEFIEAFPEAMRPIQVEARELTEMYVHAAYSPDIVDEEALDRLRKFWLVYDRMRRRVIR